MYFFFLITKLHLVFLTLWGTGADMLVWNPSAQVLKRQPELLGLLGTLPGLNYYYYIYEFALVSIYVTKLPLEGFKGGLGNAKPRQSVLVHFSSRLNSE